MRLFVAVHFSPSVNQALVRAQNALRCQGTGNFTRPENSHLTLAFIGETAHFEKAVHAIDTLEHTAFTAQLSRIGHFGDLYWAGLTENPALSELQQQAAHALEKEHFSLEKRSFRPHLTLCRRYCPREQLDLSKVNAALGHPTCQITRVSLMESCRIQGKLVYTERYGTDLL